MHSFLVFAEKSALKKPVAARLWVIYDKGNDETAKATFYRLLHCGYNYDEVAWKVLIDGLLKRGFVNGCSELDPIRLGTKPASTSLTWSTRFLFFSPQIKKMKKRDSGSKAWIGNARLDGEAERSGEVPRLRNREERGEREIENGERKSGAAVKECRWLG
ncbi:UNVERIFIED_CONTAM: Pentatricopeptide repeat-containing protein [Sesamum calycinum]|uniref:Pentatricopeptide repeat-containing protein n=1 Tax=Sesamum calycinum TaxID=2727403 RepID=A0AAW2Q602_9LAMI